MPPLLSSIGPLRLHTVVPRTYSWYVLAFPLIFVALFIHPSFHLYLEPCIPITVRVPVAWSIFIFAFLFLHRSVPPSPCMLTSPVAVAILVAPIYHLFVSKFQSLSIHPSKNLSASVRAHLFTDGPMYTSVSMILRFLIRFVFRFLALSAVPSILFYMVLVLYPLISINIFIH